MKTIFIIIGVLASTTTVVTGVCMGIKWIANQINRKNSPITNKIGRRLQLKKEFSENLQERDQWGTHGEVIIRDVKRMDSYPDIDEKSKGISPWFKVEAKGLYHRGLELFIHPPQYVVEDDKTRKWCFAKDNNEGKNKGILAYAVGRIPFDCMVEIDWQGDEYYSLPHIYCQFDRMGGQPYESVPFYGKAEGNYLFELKGFRPWDKQKGSLFGRKNN